MKRKNLEPPNESLRELPVVRLTSIHGGDAAALTPGGAPQQPLGKA